jgi:hypothetical protein
MDDAVAKNAGAGERDERDVSRVDRGLRRDPAGLARAGKADLGRVDLSEGEGSRTAPTVSAVRSSKSPWSPGQQSPSDSIRGI